METLILFLILSYSEQKSKDNHSYIITSHLNTRLMCDFYITKKKASVWDAFLVLF